MSDTRPYADEGEVIASFNGVRDQLTRIETQVIKTNGRVTSLELWRAYLTGAVAVLGFLVGGFGLWTLEHLR